MGSFARRLGSLIAVAVPLALLTLASLPRLPAGLIPADYEWVRTLGAAIDPRAVMASLILLGLLVVLRLGLRSGLGQRLMQTLVEDVFSNWRLLLLGLTGVLLSIASGYTTWDGMTNFTCPARGTGDACFGPMILSLLITFGIQGVMLIAAWLIGESFAQGLHQGRSGRAPEGRGQGVF